MTIEGEHLAKFRNKAMNMSKRSNLVLVFLVAGVLMTGVVFLALNGPRAKAGDVLFDVKVIGIPVEELPLCDEKRTAKNCAATKVDWDTLTVQVAPRVTRTVVGSTFLPNAKE